MSLEVSSEIIKFFQKQNIKMIFPEDKTAVPYLRDATFSKPEAIAVVIPNSENELFSVVKACVDFQTPLTVRGAGTGTAGSCLPEGGVLISTEKLGSIKIHEEDFMAEVEPGAFTGDINREAQKFGLFYPPDPASCDFSTIGGNVATNAGGPSTVGYGVTRDYVRKIRVIDGRGRLMDFGGEVHKFSSSYFIPSLLCGSEGTLGVFSKIWLKLIPQRPFCWYYEVSEPDFRHFSIFRKLPVSTIEYLDRGVGKLVTGVPGTFVLMKTEALDESSLKSFRKKIETVLAQKSYSWRSSSDKDEIWSVRSQVSPMSYSIAPVKTSQDIVLPFSKIETFVKWLENLSNRYSSLTVFSYGHIGDGNLHVNIMSDEKNRFRAADFQKHIMFKVREMGGMPSGEHGVGFSRKKWLKEFFSEDAMKLMKNIKKTFDPFDIMNPGKIF